MNIVEELPKLPTLNPTNGRKPPWLKIKLSDSPQFFATKNIVKKYNLNTVCSSARCPNASECWAMGTATFMILGDICTRSCGFCNIKTGKPEKLDTAEPERVAKAVQKMHVKHAVITSVNRDELPDGGAEVWADTIRAIRKNCPDTRVEVLIPDFKGDWKALQTVIAAKPDILNHNMESIARLYKQVRPQAKYERSLELLRKSKELEMITKTGFMVGIGEAENEVIELLNDIRNNDVDIVTIGQYLQPSSKHLPVNRWVHPDEFDRYKKYAVSLGFKHVESGPLVRSSYHAEGQI